MQTSRLKINRRRFLLASIFGGTVLSGIVAVVPAIRRHVLKDLDTAHVEGHPDRSLFDPRVLDTIAVLLGTLFGHELSEEDHAELIDRLTFAVDEDSEWRKRYADLVRFVDQEARYAGGVDFITLHHDQRERVLDPVMQIDLKSLRSRLFALVSDEERKHRHMRMGTIEHLAWLYRHSGVPWRARGYAKWPGIPGDWREYTKPGTAPQC